ncbi:unnamed protein product [Miscanthus lutarioriparius]|uniref:Thaumatin-like protein n=1 Tax=Miscanthus lutarioriparius TaxID=422564 RepID=A0A811RHU0_9POAL|nr:unnamed protein product [Miscanthus lutarioriparius]
MASKSISLVLFLLLAAFTAGASAATFTITNNCGYTVWPAGIPVGGGTQLDQGHTWIVDVPTGTSGRFWGRTGCSFNVGSGHCDIHRRLRWCALLHRLWAAASNAGRVHHRWHWQQPGLL